LGYEQLNSILSVSHIVLTTIFSLFISLLSFKVKFLTKSGSIAVFILAFIIYAIGKLQWTIPILTFFVFSSILSKIRKNKNKNVESFFEKSSQRDYAQVVANGGTATVLIILYFFTDNNTIFILYVASIAAVCADTWATEIGTMKKNKTYSILNFKKVDQGISGGISFNGILGAIAGALLISLSSVYWTNINHVFYIFVLIISAVLASFVDSFLGAAFQVQYRCVSCNSITEKQIHCNEPAVKNGGVTWINNDVVNFTGSAAGVIFCFLFQFFFRA
jgi:uncharacterized protein (TIGR00297 family)